jgi:hypothetical protein
VNLLPVDAYHISIGKPEGKNDQVYRRVRLLIEENLILGSKSMVTSNQFDVFLSHNSKDKPMVRELGEALQKCGLSVWLDEWELVPGRPWQQALEEIIKTTKSAVVLVGKDGLGPWEEPEMRACLEQFVRRRLPVIPVLLPDTPQKPELPLFLQAFTWVDLRGGLTDGGLKRLVWGITGTKPNPQLTSSSAAASSRQAPVTTTLESGPLATWKEKLAYLQREEAITSNAAQKFELQVRIAEAKAKIQELEDSIT